MAETAKAPTMRKINGRALLLLTAVALGGAAQAPASPDTFAPGPGQPQTERACTACHSAALEHRAFNLKHTQQL